MRQETDRGYRERLRTLSDGLASTQLQLATLKANRDKEKSEAAKARFVNFFLLPSTWLSSLNRTHPLAE